MKIATLLLKCCAESKTKTHMPPFGVQTFAVNVLILKLHDKFREIKIFATYVC